MRDDFIENLNSYIKGEISKSDFLALYEHISANLLEIQKMVSLNSGLLKEIIINQNDILFDFGNFKLLSDSENPNSIIHNYLIFSNYEPEIFFIISQLTSSNSVFVDIGANVGFLSIFVASIGVNEIISFEPNPKSFDLLKKNLELNSHLRTKVKEFDFALSNSIGDSVFYQDLTNPAASSYRRLFSDHNYSEIIIHEKTLDSLDLELVDLIKIDIEGRELFAIEGAIQTIKKFKPILIVEMLRKWSKIHGYHPNEIIQLLSKIGYICFEIYNYELSQIESISETTLGTNFLFLQPIHNKHVQNLKEKLRVLR